MIHKIDARFRCLLTTTSKFVHRTNIIGWRNSSVRIQWTFYTLSHPLFFPISSPGTRFTTVGFHVSIFSGRGAVRCWTKINICVHITDQITIWQERSIIASTWMEKWQTILAVVGEELLPRKEVMHPYIIYNLREKIGQCKTSAHRALNG